MEIGSGSATSISCSRRCRTGRGVNVDGSLVALALIAQQRRLLRKRPTP
jgi:hypothetical protein